MRATMKLPQNRPRKIVRCRPSFRPSLLDPALKGDPWLQTCTTHQGMVLYIQCQPVAMLAALPFDHVSLNHRLFDMRRRVPRGMMRPEQTRST